MDQKIELLDSSKEHIARVKKAILDYKIDFTEEGIDFVLNKLNRSFEDTQEYSDENLKTIVICGLPSHDRSEALKFIGELRKDGIPYKIQHTILVDILKKDHFFMDTDTLTSFWNIVGHLLSE